MPKLVFQTCIALSWLSSIGCDLDRIFLFCILITLDLYTSMYIYIYIYIHVCIHEFPESIENSWKFHVCFLTSLPLCVNSREQPLDCCLFSKAQKGSWLWCWPTDWEQSELTAYSMDMGTNGTNGTNETNYFSCWTKSTDWCIRYAVGYTWHWLNVIGIFEALVSHCRDFQVCLVGLCVDVFVHMKTHWSHRLHRCTNESVQTGPFGNSRNMK